MSIKSGLYQNIRTKKNLIARKMFSKSYFQLTHSQKRKVWARLREEEERQW